MRGTAAPRYPLSPVGSLAELPPCPFAELTLDHVRVDGDLIAETVTTPSIVIRPIQPEAPPFVNQRAPSEPLLMSSGRLMSVLV